MVVKNDTKVYYAIRLKLKITNNEAKYEATLTILAIAGALALSVGSLYVNVYFGCLQQHILTQTRKPLRQTWREY